MTNSFHWPAVGRPEFPDLALDAPCCESSCYYGPERCTCWEPVYNLDQQFVDEQARALLAAGIEPNTRSLMCVDCAYRPGSPEKSADPTYQGDADELERIAREDRFWCHQGTRRPVKWVHRSGAEIPGHPASYRPPVVDAVPYKANGTPSDLCAGWAARRKALSAPKRE